MCIGDIFRLSIYFVCLLQYFSNRFWFIYRNFPCK